MYPVVAHADAATPPFRPQRLQSAVLLQALARVRRVDEIEVHVLQTELAQRVSAGPNDRGSASAVPREEFRRDPDILALHIGPLLEKYS